MDKMKLLLVDDKTENLFALESLLNGNEIEFFRATSGVEALELLLTHEFALAILDVQMPEMDGFELAELMRGTEQTRSVPIIFVTAGVRDRMSTFRGYEKGAVDFLNKPLDSHVVKSKVQIFIDLGRQRQLLRLQLHETQRALEERDRALEAVQEALRTRDEFMSIASHELKTPLTSLHLQIQMMSRMMKKLLFSRVQSDSQMASQEAPPLERFLHGLQVCERQSGKLSSLLDELLDLTRVRLGQLQLTKEKLNLHELTQEIVSRFQIEADQKKLSIFLEPAAPCEGEWDRTRVEQVVTNLVSNAIKYGNGKPISIRLEQDSERKLIRFVIVDQGIGVPDAMQEKIFQRFERAVEGNQISGLGLGLYITRQIVEAHGGTISLRSRVDHGSTFVVELPCSDAKGGAVLISRKESS